MEWVAADAAQMQALARDVVAPHLRAGDLLILTGGLGAGKTTFTQGLAESLGVRGPVASPTFIIARVHPSEVGGPALIHVDAYRLRSLAELDDLDLDATVDDAVTVVEWGENMAEVLSPDYLVVTIDRESAAEVDMDHPDGGPRIVTLSAYGPRWQSTPLAEDAGKDGQ